jgi:hypothetical protein
MVTNSNHGTGKNEQKPTKPTKEGLSCLPFVNFVAFCSRVCAHLLVPRSRRGEVGWSKVCGMFVPIREIRVFPSRITQFPITHPSIHQSTNPPIQPSNHPPSPGKTQTPKNPVKHKETQRNTKKHSFLKLRDRAKIDSVFMAQRFWSLARRERRAYPASGFVRSEPRSQRPKDQAGNAEVIFARSLKQVRRRQ